MKKSSTYNHKFTVIELYLKMLFIIGAIACQSLSNLSIY